MRISDWSSDVCSSDLRAERRPRRTRPKLLRTGRANAMSSVRERGRQLEFDHEENGPSCDQRSRLARRLRTRAHISRDFNESEEHTSELQSPMRISYAVFCLTKKHSTTTFFFTQHLN